MSTESRRVRISEEGPREGFQSEPAGIPTEAKLELIEALAQAGLAEINCCSFVNEAKVPQMADAEILMARLHRQPGVAYTGLWLNRRGFERALASGVDLKPTLVNSASETFAVRNNGRDRAGLLHGQRGLAKAYREADLSLACGYVFTAFGCNYEGEIATARVTECVEQLMTLALEEGISCPVLYLCDTVGAGTPAQVRELVDRVRTQWPDLEVGLHLHDTRGLGLANALAGLDLGVRRFDASVGGLGGCPFAGSTAAAGNICTEDLAYLCEQQGLETGIDIDKLIACSLLAERIVGRKLPGKLKEAGRFRPSNIH